MREWKFWDWAGYTTLFLAVLFLALVEGVKKMPAAYTRDFMDWSIWAFLPLMLFALGSVILFFRHLEWIGARALQPSPQITTANRRGLVPMWKIVAHVAERTDDTVDDECFKATRTLLRQKASDGGLKIRGLRQLETHVNYKYDDVQTDIPQSYWAKSEIAPMATDQRNRDGNHTTPKEFNSWGPKGMDERKSYSDLHADWERVLETWPKD